MIAKGIEMLISKKDARYNNIAESHICKFHESNPDQTGIFNCKKCLIIQDKCGCDQFMGCEICGEPL
jgi:hypothetical protein